MEGPAKRAVSCPICSEKFFPASLPFHQKQCQKRQSKRLVNCPYCSLEVTQISLPDHVKVCPKGAGKRVGGQKGGGGGKGGGERARGAPAQPEAQQAAPDGRFDPEVAADGRMRCVYCGRFFTPDRIDHHQKICGNLKSARPAGVDGQPTQHGKVFNSEAQRLGQGAAFVSPQKFKKMEAEKAATLARSKQSKTQPNWRRAHEEFQSVCRAGRDDPSASAPLPAASQPPSGMVLCQHCGRHFSQVAAERHIPICAKVINKPKPPPSPSPSTRGLSPARGRGASPARQPTPQRARPAEDAHQEPPPSSRTPGGNRNRRPSPQGRRPAEAEPQGPSGSGLRAARSIRESASDERLPTAAGPPQMPRGKTNHLAEAGASTLRINDGASASSTPPSASSGRSVKRAPLQPDQSASLSEAGMDATIMPATHRAPATRGLGLRRSAMLFRLLSQVPERALARELEDCGVHAAELDQEGMIEALLAQLS